MASLGNDLASIRKELNLSIEDVKQKTKIPAHILTSIEDGSIFEDMNENNTYIRSYVRSYAKAVHIKNKNIVNALDRVQKGIYKGELLEGRDLKQPPKFQYDSPKEATETDTDDMVHDHVPDSSESDSSQEKPDKEEPAVPKPVATPPSVNTVDWADMGRKFTPMQSKSRLWIGIVILIIAIAGSAAVVWYQFYGNSSESESRASENETTQPAVDPDSLQLNLSDPAGTDTNSLDTGAAATPATLPDTLIMLIYAAYDKLEPVRVNTDVINSLNPYWIEQGVAFEFEFVNQIEFRGQYRRMELLLNGHVIENFSQQFLNKETGMIEINRSFFENDPKWLQPAPDSLDIPQPITIKNRPIFN